MTETGLVQISNPLGVVETSVNEVRSLLFGDKQVVPTDTEIGLFLKVCSAFGLNPFVKDAHLIKYKDGQPAAIVVGKDSFTKKARYAGASWRAGIVVQRGSQVLTEEGSMLAPGDVLLGGWAAVLTAEGQQFNEKVSMKEYGSFQSTWKSMPATMIRKVALVHALREAYPDIFGGLYDASEMAQAFPKNDDLIAEVGTGEVDMPSIELPDEFTEPVDLGESAPPTTTTNGEPQVSYNGSNTQGIECPLHSLAILQPQTGKFGPYWSHKEGKGWCNMPDKFKPNTTGKAAPFVDAWNDQIKRLLVKAKATQETRDTLKAKVTGAEGPEAWAEVVSMLHEIIEADPIEEETSPDAEGEAA